MAFSLAEAQIGAGLQMEAIESLVLTLILPENRDMMTHWRKHPISLLL